VYTASCVVVLGLLVGAADGDDGDALWGSDGGHLKGALSAPRDVFDQDVSFTATVRPNVTGKVRFALKTYSGTTLWTRSAGIADGKASVVLKGSEAAKMKKGGCVLVATVNDHQDRSAYIGIRLLGRIFRDVVEAPAELRPGDEIVITDTSRLQPADAIGPRSVKGKWWRRGYTVPGKPGEHALVCVEEQDLDDPKSCLAPPLRLPLNLKGWYEVWVRTYRHRSQGGIDVRLSGQKYFLHADPQQICTVKDRPHPPYGALVDVLYRADDLTGQDLVFQQPYGTYESQTKLCNASLAGVRLVKLSDEQVARLRAERARQDTKIIGFDNDGFSYFHVWGEHDPACIARLLEPLRDGSAAFLNYELGGLGGIFIPTPYTGMYQMTGHTRHGDYRANAFYRWCFRNDVNIVRVLTERAHELGLKLFVSLMMERCFSPDKTMRAHRDWRITRGRGTWDYARPEVHDYQVKKIAWIMANHDIDGFVVDFTRYGHYFNEDEPNKFAHMNAFLRKLRAAADEVNAKKDRKVLLCCSFADESYFIKHWGTGKLEDQGLDVKTWIAEGLFDMLMPEGPTALDFVKRAAGTQTAVWPRKVARHTFKTDKYLGGGGLSPKALERGVKRVFDQGAPGIFFFNHETWTTLARLGFKEELDLRTRTEDVYGLHEGPVVAFATWYPNVEEKDAQRDTLKPPTIAADVKQNVDGELVIPIRNTFKHPVTARAGWASPSAKKAESWTITPQTRSVSIRAGERGNVSFHLTGRAPRQAAVPAAQIELLADEQVVFRHRLPVRAVRRMVCKKVSPPPTIDGKLDDPAWARLRGPDAYALVPVGKKPDRPGRTTMAVGCDDRRLYVACACTGIDVTKIPTKAQKRDARGIYQTDNVEVLIDAKADEKAYLQFVVTPAGGQADARSYYYPFVGHFWTKRDWTADWTARTARRDDGYAIELAIPFKALGATPRPGDVWRMNVIANAHAGRTKPQTSAWSSSQDPCHKTECFGTLVFR